MSDMVTIREEELIESVADALQYISYYHPMDYIEALGEAYEAEQGPAAKDAIAQILTNSRMCAEGHRPICQDTGIVNVFVKWGQDCRLGSDKSLQEVVDEGVRRAYNHPDNKLRASILADPAFTRRDNDAPVIGGIAGFSGGELLLAFFANGALLNFYGFVPVALGGLGNNRGAIIGGLALGLFQQAANFLVGGIFSSVAVFTLFIVVLLAAPQGLFGSATARRV